MIPTELISAALGALSGGGVTFWTHRQDVRQTRTNAVRTVLVSLVDLREAAAALWGTENSEGPLALLNQKRAMYLAIAESGASRAWRALSSDDLVTLGLECQTASKYSSARAYYLEALGRTVSDSDRPGVRARVAAAFTARRRHLPQAADPLSRVVVLRSLADYYLAPGPHRDVARAAGYFQSAVDETQASADPNLQLATGYTYERWAYQWAAEGSDDYQEKLEAAKNAYRQIANSSQLGDDPLAKLEARERDGFYLRLRRMPPSLVRAANRNESGVHGLLADQAGLPQPPATEERSDDLDPLPADDRPDQDSRRPGSAGGP